MTRRKAAVAEPAPSFTLADQAVRRVAAEFARAEAYLRVRGGADALAAARLRERVTDEEAFWVLVGCQGSKKQAAALLEALAGQRLGTLESDDEEEAVA